MRVRMYTDQADVEKIQIVKDSEHVHYTNIAREMTIVNMEIHAQLQKTHLDFAQIHINVEEKEVVA